MGEVAEAERGAAQVLEAPVDRLGRAVAGAGPVEEREDVRGALLHRATELADLHQRGGDCCGDRGLHHLLSLLLVGFPVGRDDGQAVSWCAGIHPRRRGARAAASRYPDVVRFTSYTGLRWGEVTGIRVKNVDLERRRVLIEENAVEVNGHVQVGTPKTLDTYAELFEDDLDGVASALERQRATALR